MEVIIPAAGYATRMRPLSHTRPKAIMPVAGKPIIGHILDEIEGINPDVIHLIIGENGMSIYEYVESRGFNVDYVIQREMLGLGYAVSLAEGLVKSDKVLIILGDTPFKMSNLNDEIKKGDFIAVKEVSDPRRFGIVKVEGGKILDMVEKPKNPPSNLAIVGIYYITKAKLLFDSLKHIISQDIRTKGEYQLTDALREMIRRGHNFRPVEVEEWLDCGTLDQTIISQRELLKYNQHYVSRETVTIIEPVWISDQADIRNCVIGPNVHIDAGCKIKNSIISNSIIYPNCTIEDSVLNDSIIGESCEVRGFVGSLRIGDHSHVG
jgi:Nucleoside-diphosphate-sugar pyrophosphorylase involved in lipopolysaccharide biosynthesis/translation initiation factor 2B, gamma/epsilon subunits (eIF-2Bgamma/eIF-2Bepsilon)